jgi:hypothetical protein
MVSGTATPSSSITSVRTSLVERSRTPRMYSSPAFSSAAMVAALIMPRSATTQTWAMPKRSRRRWTTGISRVTSAVLPGHRKEANGRSSPSSTMPSTTCLRCGR